MGASAETCILCLTAASIGTGHTLLGPDHFIPFVAMSRAGDWSAQRTLLVTACCGLGHVAGSVLIGLVGLALGTVAMTFEAVESLRGDMAAWMLIAFGIAYLAWGIVQAGRSATHVHRHARGASNIGPDSWTPRFLFLVFVFGPCEPLIPLLIHPAAMASPWAVAGVVSAFTFATVATMVLTVMLMRRGMTFLHLPQSSRCGHAFAGLAILICGALVMSGL